MMKEYRVSGSGLQMVRSGLAVRLVAARLWKAKASSQFRPLD